MAAADSTIFAVSTGGLPSGVAVIRLSGPHSADAIRAICGELPEPRKAVLRTFSDPAGGEQIDRGLVLFFAGPASFTGEDSAEFHCHGSRAVVAAMLEALCRIPGLRLAEPGEFSRRAFDNGRLDLTQLEGLADLIAAETQGQRRQALRQAGGFLRDQFEEWHRAIIRMRALVEAELDFPEEEDIPGSVAATVWADADSLAKQIRSSLDSSRNGEIVREGLQVVLLGPPNAGKSSLLNALARREVAIVSDEAGTTRDLVEVSLELHGQKVVVVDTAGLRESAGSVEREGMRRARQRAGSADLAVWLSPPEDDSAPEQGIAPALLRFMSKDDHGKYGRDGLSVRREDGLDPLLNAIAMLARDMEASEAALVTRARHRQALSACAAHLDSAAKRQELPIELRSEELRGAGDELARLTGRIDTDDLLDVIFREFCIGK